MRRRYLNRNKAYAEVVGLPGAAYEQNGVFFRLDGREVFSGEVEPIVEEKKVKTKDEPLPYICCIEVQTEPMGSVGNGGNDIGSMSEKALKVLVESYGGIYSNRKSAISFLKGNISY